MARYQFQAPSDPRPGIHHDSREYIVPAAVSEKESSSWRELDDDIVRSIEEVLRVDIPVDSKLLYRVSQQTCTTAGKNIGNLSFSRTRVLDSPGASTCPETERGRFSRTR